MAISRGHPLPQALNGCSRCSRIEIAGDEIDQNMIWNQTFDKWNQLLQIFNREHGCVQNELEHTTKNLFLPINVGSRFINDLSQECKQSNERKRQFYFAYILCTNDVTAGWARSQLERKRDRQTL